MALQRPTQLVMGPCIVKIDHIIIREVQYQIRRNFWWVWPLWAGRSRVVEIDRTVIREVQYQFEVNRCRNEEIIVKGNFGSVWSMWAGLEIYRIVIREVQYQFEGAPGLVMGPCIFEIDRIVIREVQYQLEVNRLKGNFGLAWSMWAGVTGLVMKPCIVEIDRIVITDFQGSSAYRRTDGLKTEITTISPLFLRKAWG
ncbi:hypothetical protein DPMN_191009 [Dreissena polymorpha]|uniref:Uncharacterized protein n=1 Tax=Dreissena polymorpha TaxID=45954 RepID=A0A9D4BE64_DREPO|nr:hypothetical protein DPMN_191009 [Dreissena polymorpha]